MWALLPEGFVLRMKKLLVAEFDAFAASYDRPRNVGLRRNPQKGAQLALPEFGLTPVPWCADGFYYDAAARPGLSPLHEAGCYYLQEPSAMAPAELLDVRPGMRVLDLCAAPGGKSTQLAAKLAAEGADTDCDIIIGMSYGYLDSLRDNLAPIDFVDTSVFMSDLLQADSKYIPWDRFSGATIVNTDILAEKGLEAPASYEDLLKDEYKGLIEMPNPTASSTGYLYLKSLVNAWGEDEAFAYFDKLDANILKYTDSGSGPIKDLEAGECAIGLSLTFNAVEAINEGAPLDIIFFEEGAPYSPTGCAIISGRETDPAVQAVFSYLYSGVQDEYLATYLPEQVKIDQKTDIENFPSDIPYADMSNDTPDVKTALLDKWAY